MLGCIVPPFSPESELRVDLKADLCRLKLIQREHEEEYEEDEDKVLFVNTMRRLTYVSQSTSFQKVVKLEGIRFNHSKGKYREQQMFTFIVEGYAIIGRGNEEENVLVATAKSNPVAVRGRPSNMYTELVGDGSWSTPYIQMGRFHDT